MFHKSRRSIGRRPILPIDFTKREHHGTDDRRLSPRIAGAIALLPFTVVGITSAAAQDAPVALPEITIQGSNGDSIADTPPLLRTPEIGKTGTKVEDLPLSVKVVPTELITQQGGTQLSDALRNVSGASIGGNDANGAFDRFLIRGLDARIYSDGFSEGEQINGVPHSLNGVQSVEILKGPGSALLGSGPPGGTINITHYLPSSTFAAGVGTQYGSFNALTSNFWVTGPTTIPGINYRIDATVAHSDGFRDLKSGDYEIRPVLTWAIQDHFITAALDLRRIQGTPDTYGLIYFHGAPLDVSRDAKYSTPFAFDDQTYIRTELSDAWTFNKILTINNRFAYTHREAAILRDGDSDAIVGTTMTGRVLRQQDDIFNTFDYALEPTWKFETASIRHTLVTGFEAQHQTLFTNQTDATLPNIANIFDPVPLEMASLSGLNFTRSGTRGLMDSLQATYLGLYATDQIDVTDQLKLRFSGRQNWWSTTLTPDIFVPGRFFEGNQLFEPGVNYSRSDQPFDWSAGVLYKIIPGVSPYFGVAQSHLANFSSEATSAAIQAPESALQYEVGVKFANPDNSLQLTVAAFDIHRQNVFTLVNDEPTFGNQFTRGFEADLQFAVTPQWKILANGTIQQAVLTANPSQPAAVGNVPIGVPLHMVNIWTTYDFDIFGTKGFRIGAGMEYRGKIFGDALNTDTVPSYAIFSANISYIQPKWDVTFGIKNIADTLYFVSAEGAGALVGDPRTYYVKANWRF